MSVFIWAPLAEELFQKLLLQDKYFTHNCTYNLCVCHAYCPYLSKITSNIIPQSIEKYSITVSFLEMKSYHNFLHTDVSLLQEKIEITSNY